MQQSFEFRYTLANSMTLISLEYIVENFEDIVKRQE